MQGVDPAFNQGPDALRCFAERRAKEISEWLRKHEAKRLRSTVTMAFHGPPWGQLQTCADRVRLAAGQFWTTLICL